MKKRMNEMRIVVILDKSGSMGSVQQETATMFNNYVKELEKDTAAKYRLSLSLFDTTVERRHVDIPLEDTVELDSVNYMPNGWTALYDAIGLTVNELKKKVKEGDKVLVVVITDGAENSSKEYGSTQVKDMITEAEKNGWKFVYLGANQDSWTNSQNLGFRSNSVADFNATTKGLSRTEQIIAANTMSYAASVDHMDNSDISRYAFFSQEDKKDLKTSK